MDAKRALGACREYEEREQHARARQEAEAGLGRGDLDKGLVAELRDCLAWGAYFGKDRDAVATMEAALAGWEGVPGAEPKLAILSEFIGKELALQGEFRPAEAHLRRSVALREKLPGAPYLARSLFGLFDVLDQTCRVDEAAGVLSRFATSYAADKDYLSWYPGLPEHHGAVLARRKGDLATARSQLARVSPQLEGPEVDAGYALSVYEFLADYARDAGDYHDALKHIEGGVARWGVTNDRAATLDLALAYRAAADPRFSDYESRHFLTFVSAGKELFPTRLPPVEACVPSTGPEPRGWLYEGGEYELAEACVTHAQTGPTQGASLMVVVRIEQGRAVASGVVGKAFEPALLECVAKRALEIGYPGPHHFNFRSTWYVHETPPE